VISNSRHRQVKASGHRFGPELECQANGCSQTWSKQQQIPTECYGQLGSMHLSPLGKHLARAMVPLWRVAQESGYTVTTVRRVLTPSLWPDLMPSTIETVTRAAEAQLRIYDPQFTKAGSVAIPLLLESGLPAAPA
jgi:hypothetical protein